jgi:hypothetical protein
MEKLQAITANHLGYYPESFACFKNLGNYPLTQEELSMAIENCERLIASDKHPNPK